jgi:pyruvate,water dikinase
VVGLRHHAGVRRPGSADEAGEEEGSLTHTREHDTAERVAARAGGWLARLLGRGRSTGGSAERLRAAFRQRYNHFKLLLQANTEALEVMAEIETALRAGPPFGMAFVRRTCTTASVSVHRVVRSLRELAPRRYRALEGRLRAIQEQLRAALEAAPAAGEELVLPLATVDAARLEQAGHKMAWLGEASKRLGVRVPPGFVVTTAAFRRFLEEGATKPEIDGRLQAADLDDPVSLLQLSSGIQQLVVAARVPPDLEHAILEAYTHLEVEAGEAVRLSVRSSALGEDAAGASFAGQFRSELNVHPEHLIQVYKEVVASAYGVPAITYRLHRGLREEDVPMAVGCLAMVDAAAGGVAYSASPLAGASDAVLITATPGLPKLVVDGATPCDTFRVARGERLEVVERTVARKSLRLACDPEEGLARVELGPEEATAPAIDDAEALAVAGLALRLEEAQGRPVDVEWAFTRERRLVLLQCRPMLRVPEVVRPKPPAAEPLLAGGVTASPGAGSGEVAIVRNQADLLRFPRRAVLVAAQAAPSWASLLGRAAAVVTEQGSATSHLASVAREFGVPAVFGMDGALARLRDGDLVTVDADGRAAYSGRMEALLTAPSRPPAPAIGTPVHQVLAAAARLVLPLNLLDPAAPEFRPQSCRTLHDVTRFCHEKAVEEMFRFGVEHRFPERSSKRLVTDVPMQMWVLDLEDGFREEVPGPEVRLETIVSIPMRALWEGMSAAPWAGPPPVDPRGLLSVLFQATLNPDLDPASASRYSERNYFLISRHYCSLQSRFGFHFCTVEALVGERPSENYVSFSFKGGAADEGRRALRARMVGSILERHGFRTETLGDSLRARTEGYEQGETCERLKVVGYLVVHTRQLDMIMANDAAVAECRARLDRGIDSLLGGRPAAG